MLKKPAEGTGVGQEQWEEVHARAALPEEHPRRITRHMMDALLEGRLQSPARVDLPVTGALPPDYYRIVITDETTIAPNDPLMRWGWQDLFCKRRWQLESSWVGRELSPGEHIVLLKCFGIRTTIDMAILWGNERGYLASTHLVNAAFAKAHPQDQGGKIIGAGDFVSEGKIKRRVSALGRVNGQFSLDTAAPHQTQGPNCIYSYLCI